MNIETPCILIDVDIMKKNIVKMANMAKANGVKLRPHIKTHKIPEIARMQLEAGAVGVTSAKISEAEIMAQKGIKDIFIAFPIIGKTKIKRLLDLNRKVRLIAAVDSIAGAKALSEAAETDGQTVEVRLEIDTGMRRTGVPYFQAVEAAKKISGMKGLKLTGIYTFKGPILKGKATSDRNEAGLEEGRLMAELASILRNEGINIVDVSVGSSPTADSAARVEGVTEIRPGTYVFNDAMQVSIGSCSLDDCAARVMVTVVSTPAPDLTIVDGGCKAIATDAIPGISPYYLKGYGIIMGHDNLELDRLSEEHGMIKVEGEHHNLNIGDKLLIIPNHICPTINLHDKVYFVKDGKVIKEVPVSARGKVY